MRSTREYLFELEQLGTAPAGDRRVELLRRVTDLFFLTSGRQSDSDRAVFDQAMTLLAYQVDTSARAELAARLCATRAPPEQLMRRLALDEIEVAGRVLEHAVGLSEDDMLAAARAGGPEHGRAIVARTRLGRRIAEELAARGADDVSMRLAAHRGAALTRRAFELLTERAESVPELVEALEQRPDLPRDLQRTLRTPRRNRASDTHRVLADEAALARAARAGRTSEAVRCFAALTGLDLSEAESCLLRGETPALAVLCKAHGFAATTFSALLQLRLTAGSLSPKGMAGAMRRYETMAPDLAQRIVHFLRLPTRAE